jgi:hypothetical protein
MPHRFLPERKRGRKNTRQHRHIKNRSHPTPPHIVNTIKINIKKNETLK